MTTPAWHPEERGDIGLIPQRVAVSLREPGVRSGQRPEHGVYAKAGFEPLANPEKWMGLGEQ